VLKGDHLGTALLAFFYFVLLRLIVSVLLLFLKRLVFALIHLVIHSGTWWDYWHDVVFSFHARFFLERFKHLNRLLR
jgi:hypothetical protein